MRLRPTALLCASIAALVLTAASASAAPVRNLDFRNFGLKPPTVPFPGPFNSPSALAVDSAGDIYVGGGEREGFGITEYDPSGGFLAQFSGDVHLYQGTQLFKISSLAIDEATGNVYFGGLFGDPFHPTYAVTALTDTGALIRQIPIVPAGNCDRVSVAVDNSGGATQGRLLAGCGGGGAAPIQMFDSNGSPLDFTETTAPYISGNEITGTPSSPEGGLAGIEGLATDTHGNIYVSGFGSGNGATEFAPSGKFLRKFTGEEVPGGFNHVDGVAVDPTNGNVLLSDRQAQTAVNGALDEYTSSGEFLGQITESAPGAIFAIPTALAFDPLGRLYVAVTHGGAQPDFVDRFLPLGVPPRVLAKATTGPASGVERNSATLSGEADPNSGGKITDCHFAYVDAANYSPWADDPYAQGPLAGTAPCLDSADHVVGTSGEPIESPTEVHAPLAALRSSTIYHYRLSLANSEGASHGEDLTLETSPAVTAIETQPATKLTNVSAELHGSFTAEEGLETEFFFEYGTSPGFGHTSAVNTAPAALAGTESREVGTEIAGLIPGATYYYRFVAENEHGITTAPDKRTFTTDQAPTIDAFSTANVTATGADLKAQLEPHGFATKYRFEYGPTTAYGQSVPVPDGQIAEELSSAHSVQAHVSGLEGHIYHFRVVAESQWGTVTSEDQTFEFFPPACPNSAVRQQTGSAYLPDCRAYELVSPGNANGTLLYSGGPNTGQATAPSRFSFTGNANSLKGANTIETVADLYTATRTDTGWESKYIGLPGDQAGCMGGPPNSPTSHVVFGSPPLLTNTVLTDPSMSRLLIWLDGTPISCSTGPSPFFDNNWEKASPSNAPYMFNADGSIDQRLPSSFPGGSGAVEALKCPYPNHNYVSPPCTGDVTASADLSHFVFSSNKASFAEGGVEEAPGSAYDNDLATNSVSLISLDSAGHPIAQDPNFAPLPPECLPVACVTDAHGEIASRINAPGGKEEFIRFPAVSSDGSHILMSTATARTFVCDRGGGAEPCHRYTDTPIHLYMRINDTISYEPSRGEDGVNHAVKFLGMTPDGSKVFFTSEERLIAADKDTSTDLYMWSESSNSLTLVSKGDNAGEAGEAGQSDSCSASWTTKCGIQPYSNYQWSLLPGGEGGNGIADSAITPGGDVYFYSPEQLDGDRGVLGGQNLYDYREGKARFVATLEPEKKCRSTNDSHFNDLCAEGPIVRFEATPTDSRAAFLTTTRLTSYDNAGHIEMYSFTPSSGEIVCDSCRPDGKAPTDDVKASQDGRFITNDGRVFFSTADPLVPQDTNEGIDVYEFVDGRPQLITPGTGTATAASGETNVAGFAEKPGLVGVSNDGTDVYFDTFDLLTAEDHNGNFLKFYDARVNGGFAQPTPVPPCLAAEECHGAGSSAPDSPTQGTAAGLSGGNVKQKAAAKHRHKAKKHKKAAKRHRARAAKSKGRAGK